MWPAAPERRTVDPMEARERRQGMQLDAARAGDARAWDSLYEELAPVVLGYLRARGAADAEELTGRVFREVIRGIERFEGDERDFRAWVLVTAHRALRDENGSRDRHANRTSGGSATPDLTDRGRTAAAAVDLMDVVDRSGDGASERVQRVMSGLDPEQRSVLLLRVLGNLSIDEVARVMGVQAGTVAAVQRRGLAAVRAALVAESVRR
jgi:RNA polymerase sigma-70 factor (ECF subfamily)